MCPFCLAECDLVDVLWLKTCFDDQFVVDRQNVQKCLTASYDTAIGVDGRRDNDLRRRRAQRRSLDIASGS